MPVTPASPWRNPPRISLASFERVLRQGNPGVLAERPAIEYYNAIVSRGVDPLYVLAKFNHESSLGTAGVAVTTHSWGNTREPNFGAVPVGSVPGRSGTFPVWRDWLDGLRSTVGRLVSPEWVYFDRESIAEIYEHPSGKVWAPAGDFNNPAGYLRAVIDFMNAHEDVVMQAEIPGFLWVPETCGEFGYPKGTKGRNGVAIDRLIIHYTDGVDSLDWLTQCHGNSAHFLTEKDGAPRAQMVALSDAAWAAGNRDFNLRGVNLEIERTASEARSWPDALIENVARIAADICKACPGILPDREHIIGHGDVPRPNTHTDPGPFFPWPHFLDLVQRFVHPTPPYNPFFDEATGHYVHEAFQPRFSLSEFGLLLPSFADCVKIWGHVVEGAFLEEQPDGKVLLTQYFERAQFFQFEDGRVEGNLLGADRFRANYPNGRTPD